MTRMEYWMGRARLAATESDDPDTQVGAILVFNDDIISHGANIFPTGVEVTEMRKQRPAKYNWIQHAENVAISRAGKFDVSLCTMYTTVSPCQNCMGSVIMYGIKRVVAPPTDTSANMVSRAWHKSQWVAKQMAAEAGVELVVYRGE